VAALPVRQPAMPVVGLLIGEALDGAAPRLAAFRKGLGEIGYVEGQNVLIEYHWLGDVKAARAVATVRRAAFLLSLGCPQWAASPDFQARCLAVRRVGAGGRQWPRSRDLATASPSELRECSNSASFAYGALVSLIDCYLV
jgi:hypothetical protein